MYHHTYVILHIHNTLLCEVYFIHTIYIHTLTLIHIRTYTLYIYLHYIDSPVVLTGRTLKKVP